MSKVEAILKQLADVAANPKKAMDDYKAETGKGAIGIMPLYAPEELVHATGYLPMGIWGGQNKLQKLVHTCQHLLVLLCNRLWNYNVKGLMMSWRQF